MLTINERRVGEAIILDLKGTLLIPDDDAALLEVVSRCASNGGRLVVLDIAGLARIDAGGLGALIRSQNLLASLGGELRLVNPNKFVGDMLRRTRLDSVIPCDAQDLLAPLRIPRLRDLPGHLEVLEASH